MLRIVVLLLVLANGAYYAWAQGLLRVWGLAPTQQSEPHRLTQQLRPEALRILGSDEARRIAETQVSGSGRAPDCLASAPLEEPIANALRSALAKWPDGSWSLEPALEPGRWIVYMGKYPAPEFVDKKKAELRQLGVSFQPVATAALEPGLSLGGFATQPLANAHLETLNQRGVRTARVVQERPELRGLALRLPALDEALRARLDELKAPLAGRALRACR